MNCWNKFGHTKKGGSINSAFQMDYCSLAYRCPELVSRLCSICGRSELNIAWVVEEETDQLANNKVPTWPAR